MEMPKSPLNTENMGFATETLRHRGGGALNRNGGGDTRAMRMVVKIKELSREWCVVGSDERQYCAFGYTSDCGGNGGTKRGTLSAEPWPVYYRISYYLSSEKYTLWIECVAGESAIRISSRVKRSNAPPLREPTPQGWATQNRLKGAATRQGRSCTPLGLPGWQQRSCP